MNRYRSSVLGLLTCAAGLSLAACSAGVTSASATSSLTASASHSATARPSSRSSLSGSTVRVGGSIGSFPIPSGAEVVENATMGKQTVILLGSVGPSQVSSFYSSVLPQDGYKITMNTLASGNNGTGAAIEFSGHGYKGTIGALSNLPSPAPSFAGVNGKNFTGITLTRQ
jgi:hypothetical protein